MKVITEARDMAQKVRVPTALLEDLSLVSSTLMVALTTVCEASFREFETTFWPLWAQDMHMVHTHTHKIRLKK